MAIHIEKKQVGGVAVLVLRGRVGEMESKELELAFLHVFKEGCYQIVVDFEDVNFMTSSGLGVLVMCMKRARANAGHIRIARPQPLIQQILLTTRLHQFLEIFSSVKAAVEGRDQGDTPAESR